MLYLVRKLFKKFNEKARLSIKHWKETWHKLVYKNKHKKERSDFSEVYSDHQIIEVIKFENEKEHGQDFMEEIIMKQADGKDCIFSESDYKYLSKNDIKDLYFMCLRREIDYKNYQYKINLIAPTLTILGIENLEAYTIITEPFIGIVYENRKNEKRVMDIKEITKFCDITLKKVLTKVLEINQESYLGYKDPPLSDVEKEAMEMFEK
ncbi:hypothetical protein Tco_1293865 [Tanacetum coccineum]